MISIKRRSLGDIIAEVIIYAVLLILGLLMIIPFVYVIAASFATDAYIQATPIFLWPKNPTIEAYRRIFDMNDMGSTVIRSLIVSILRTVVGTLINLAFTTTMAYGLSRSTLHGKKFVLNMVLFTMVVGGGMIPTFLLVKSLGMYDTYWSLLLPGAISAYNMLIVRNFFMDLPAGLEEAASIDGCSDIGIFLKIALPLSMPCLATFGLFYAVGHWNDYMTALLYLDDQKKYPFQLVLRNLVMQTEENTSDPNYDPPGDAMKMAVIVVGTVPILCVYPFLQKYFAAGVMVGAIKG